MSKRLNIMNNPFEMERQFTSYAAGVRFRVSISKHVQNLKPGDVFCDPAEYRVGTLLWHKVLEIRDRGAAGVVIDTCSPFTSVSDPNESFNRLHRYHGHPVIINQTPSELETKLAAAMELQKQSDARKAVKR